MSSTTDVGLIQVEVAPTYAPSLPVPNVQEIVRTYPFHVPDRYLRDQEEIPENIDLTSSNLSSEIPIIDFSLLSKGNKEELHKLDVACEEWGFFQIVNHGVAKEVLWGMKDVAAKFFELPLEEKNKVSMPSDDIQGYGHAYVVSEDQILDWSDALILNVYPVHYRNLKFWPAEPENFQEVLESYSGEVKRVGEELLRSLSKLMGMEKDTLIGLHNQLLQALRVNYYPPCSTPHKVVGLSPHSDTSTITILMQEDGVTGLQIRKGGEWVSVEPIPDALVVNVGDVLEERLSYASFLFPHFDVEIKPVYDIAVSDLTYKKVRYGDYLRQSMKMKHEGKAHTEMAKIRS
ncbi:PREDICTED: protein SRG1-like [Fragaria vesca subsp. vesca]